MAKAKLNEHTGIMMPISFLVSLLVSGLVVYLASIYFPTKVVLGTMSITPMWAIIHSIGSLALIITFALPFIREYENYSNKMFKDKDWFFVYFFINFVGIWIVTRFAEQLGFGVSSIWVVAILAAVLDFAQGIAMMVLEKFRK